MHDGTVAQGDTWLQAALDAYANWAAAHNSLLVVTFDEDDHSAEQPDRDDLLRRPREDRQLLRADQPLPSCERCDVLARTGVIATASVITAAGTDRLINDDPAVW